MEANQSSINQCFEGNGLHRLLLEGSLTASAPCRIDFGGTVDIAAFHYAMARQSPSTINFALDMRTTATLSAHDQGRVKVSSKGLSEDEFQAGKTPFREHPLGLMFAVLAWFGASGVHLHIESGSPPRSALGGSSTAAVAAVAALAGARQRLGGASMDPARMAQLAQILESNAAGVPCGIQDQLAAAFGGANQWLWTAQPGEPAFAGRALAQGEELEEISRHLMVAYCGQPHDSYDVNEVWVRGFLTGKTREQWTRINNLTQDFGRALKSRDWAGAVKAVNEELAIRLELTPQVMDPVMGSLARAARRQNCSCRFSGAGAGGCVWAMGRQEDVQSLEPAWEKLLAEFPGARILDCKIDPQGAKIDSVNDP